MLLARLSASMSFPRQACSDSSPLFASTIFGITRRDTPPKMARFASEPMFDTTDP